MWEPVNETPPCLACEDRHRACHDTCERFKAWKKKCREKRDEIEKVKNGSELYRYKIGRIREIREPERAKKRKEAERHEEERERKKRNERA